MPKPLRLGGRDGRSTALLPLEDDGGLGGTGINRPADRNDTTVKEPCLAAFVPVQQALGRGQITLAPATFFALALLCSGYPLGLVPVISVTGRTLQSLLRGIHYQIPLAVLLCEPNGIEGDSYVFFADPEEPAHP